MGCWWWKTKQRGRGEEASEDARAASQRNRKARNASGWRRNWRRMTANGEKECAEQARAAAITARVAAEGERKANEERLRQANHGKRR